MSGRPVRLEPKFDPKPWGTTQLEPWFPNRAERTGEVRFPAEEILVKFIFTSAPLSVQVHPNDEQAPTRQRGKTEMWHILRAAPGATLALGLNQPVTREQLRELALSGEIKRCLKRWPVQAGQTYFVPAGTVHAIGGGIVLCEIQQNSDITYRLYDYDSDRELHVDDAVRVARLEPHPGPVDQVSCEHFVTDRYGLAEPTEYAPDPNRGHLLIVLEGEGILAGQSFARGEVWQIPAGPPRFSITPIARARFLRTHLP